MNQSSRPSLTRIARDLDISAKTVSNAFNRPDQLSAALRQRILDHAAAIGYSGPDPLARAFRRGSTGVIGVVYGNPLSHAFADQAFVRFLTGLASVLEQEQRSMLLLPASASVADVAIGGAVVYSVATDDSALAMLASRSLPFVTVDQPRLPDVPWIGIDDYRGGQILAQHLRQRGHQHIGVVSFALTSDALPAGFPLGERPAGTLQVTEKRLRGLAEYLPAETPVRQVVGSCEQVAEPAARDLLSSHPELTALVCLGDRMAIGAMRVAQSLGLTVPDDLAIAGFDDVEAAHANITSVAQPHEAKGEAAGKSLIALLNGTEAAAQTLLDVSLIARLSTSHQR